MTLEEKNKIIELRNMGVGYGEISRILNIGKSTISTFLNRMNNENPVVCKNCGKTLKMVKGKKEKKFCSDACRYTWWNEKRKSGK